MAQHPNSARFHELLKEIGDLHNKKQVDYGKDDDPFANVRSSKEWGVSPWIGALIRLNDKVKRLQAFALKGSLANEGVDDSLRDIAVYAVISLVLYEQQSNEFPKITLPPPQKNFDPVAIIPAHGAVVGSVYPYIKGPKT